MTLSEKEVELNKEQVLEDLDHILKVGHGTLTVQVADHQIVNIDCDARRQMSKKERQLNKLT